MSRLLAFAQGALDEVIRRDKEDRALQATLEAEDRKVQNEIKIKKAISDAKGVNDRETVPGTGLSFQRATKGTSKDQIRKNAESFRTLLANNPDAFVQMTKDDAKKADFGRWYINFASSVADGQVYDQTSFDASGKQQTTINEDYTSIIKNILPSETMPFFMSLQNKVFNMKATEKANKDTIAKGTNLYTGATERIDLPPQVRAAARLFYNQQYHGPNVKFNLASSAANMTRLINPYDKDKKPLEGDNVFYTLGSDSRVRSFFTKEPTTKRTADFFKLVRNPDHNLVDVDEDTGLVSFNENFETFLFLFAPKNEGIRSSRQRGQARPSTVNVDQDSEIKAAIQGAGLISAASSNLKDYIKLVKNNKEVASGFVRDFTASIFGIKPTLTNLATVVGAAFTGNTFKSKDEEFTVVDIKPDGMHLKLQKELKEKINNISNGIEVAASRAAVYEIGLTYQLAAVLQGGLGGRTISDQDVANMVNLLGGRGVLSPKAKLSKLKTVSVLVNRIDAKNRILRLASKSNNKKYVNFIKKVANHQSLSADLTAVERSVEKQANQPIVSQNFNNVTVSLSKEGTINSLMKKLQAGNISDGDNKTFNFKDIPLTPLRDFLIKAKKDSEKEKSDFNFSFVFNEKGVPYLYSMMAKGSLKLRGFNLNTGKQVSFKKDGNVYTASDEEQESVEQGQQKKNFEDAKRTIFRPGKSRANRNTGGSS
mgnify:CR=1 FL=1|tara:strand:- start:10937 stop:13066 length:2130 start_codon:yes stop_codon:yes gene_type:complete